MAAAKPGTRPSAERSCACEHSTTPGWTSVASTSPDNIAGPNDGAVRLRGVAPRDWHAVQDAVYGWRYPKDRVERGSPRTSPLRCGSHDGSEHQDLLRRTRRRRALQASGTSTAVRRRSGCDVVRREGVHEPEGLSTCSATSTAVGDARTATSFWTCSPAPGRPCRLSWELNLAGRRHPRVHRHPGREDFTSRSRPPRALRSRSRQRHQMLTDSGRRARSRRSASSDFGSRARVRDKAPMVDVGFRVLKVDTTNMADVARTPTRLDQEALARPVTNSVKPDRTGEDLLFQVLLDWGLELTMPITVETDRGPRGLRRRRRRARSRASTRRQPRARAGDREARAAARGLPGLGLRVRRTRASTPSRSSESSHPRQT